MANAEEVDGKTLSELNEGGATYKVLGKRFGMTRGQVAGLIRRYKEGQNEQQSEGTSYEQGNDFINVICASKRILSVDEIVKQFNVNLEDWEIERYRVKTSEGYRKDRTVSWHVLDGRISKGDVEDSGKMLVVPLYHIEVRLVRKNKVVEARVAIDALKEDAKKYAPVYPKIEYPQQDGGLLYEIDMQDIHFGRLTWNEESGESYDLPIAQAAIESTLIKLLSMVKGQNISKILFPLGNDFFNVDNKFNTTTGGTPQQESERWQKTFKRGREICTWIIDTCSQIAPVDVLIIPGNHDEQRSFYLGDALECWYHNNPNVLIDNRAAKRKYYSFGKNLIGYAHGYDEPLARLPLLMAIDEPQRWASSIYREWHTGDKHNKKDLVTKTDEGSGVVIRILRSLAASDAWTFNKGYRSLRASESFLWQADGGLIAQYTATPDKIANPAS
jgi:hypothetical protein